MGIVADDWVGLMLGNDPELVVLALALSKLEAVIVPIDPTTGGRDLDMTVESAPLRAIVTRPNAIDPLAAPAGTLRMARQVHVHVPRVTPESRHRVSGTLLSCTLYPWSRPTLTGATRPEVVLFTLDSGGDPKAVVRGAGQLGGIAATLSKAFGTSGQSNVLCAAPLFDSQGFDFGLVAALSVGATLYLDDSTAGPRMAKVLLDQRIDLCATTARDCALLARSSSAKPLHPTTHLVCSGVPLPSALAAAFRQRFSVPVLSCYHSCESGPVTLDMAGQHPESVGKALPGVEIRVASDDQAGGGAGPIWVRGAGVATTFLPPLPTRAEIVPVGRSASDGWLRTGDVGYLRPDQRLVLTHREDDIVRIDRHRVALGEIESCIEALADVKAAQAHVEYDDSGSSQIVVRVTPSGRWTQSAMLDHCARQLAPHKVPKRIDIE
jgi:acyl-CoA synthetase (AMP-forming)/AMP-acid ligase II